MIGKLKGTVEEINNNNLLLDVSGVCYLVYCSTNLLSSVELNKGVEIYIETHVREDQITLFGFSTKKEKELYLQLVTVKGVGPKMGLAIVGSLEANKIANAIMAGDKDIFAQISGVGPKLANRIISELKDKNLGIFNHGDSVSFDSTMPGSSNEGLVNDAVMALQNLGISRYEAYACVSKLVAEDDSVSLGELIKKSLKQISK
ncbi:MAG: Holliday junction branch migration protein RuvA [Rickettsiales bacterium]